MVVVHTSPAEAYQLIAEGYQYLDVRTEREFGSGHPTSAVNVPIVVPDPHTRQMVINPEFLSVVEAHFAKDAKLLVGCQSGGRSQRAAELLADAGYTHVINMQGGFGGAHDDSGRTIIPGWRERGLPTCSDCSPDHTYAGLRTKVS
jgi:rhodanese-related sulfurtransferase